MMLHLMVFNELINIFCMYEVEDGLYRDKIRYQIDNFPFERDNVFTRHPEGLTLFESYMNNEMSAQKLINVLNEDGMVKGGTVDNIRKIKRDFKKHYKNQGLEVRVDSPKKRNADLDSVDRPYVAALMW